jgi:hypothetical protein
MKRRAMSSFILYPVVALQLAGCGGTINAPIGGTVMGLSPGTSISLTDNGTDTINLTLNGGFLFDVEVAAGSSYNVTIDTVPTGEICTITNPTGTVDGSGDPITNILISCVATD